jgi:hypothetical protein
VVEAKRHFRVFCMYSDVGVDYTFWKVSFVRLDVVRPACQVSHMYVGTPEVYCTRGLAVGKCIY